MRCVGAGQPRHVATAHWTTSSIARTWIGWVKTYGIPHLLAESERRRFHTKFCTAIFVTALVSACGGGGGGGTTEPEPKETAVALEAQASHDTATTSSAVTLRAITKATGTTINSYRWTLPDGRTIDGQEVVTQFPTTGKNDVTVQASAADGSTFSATTSVFVFDTADGVAQPSLSAFGIVGEIGNVDGQSGLDVLDVLTIAQHASGVNTSSLDVTITGDINLDGKVNNEDVDLALGAVGRQQRLPSALLSNTAYPATIVTVVSPVLLAADSVVEVRVDGVTTAKPLRVVLGYATFVVPTNLIRLDATLPVEIVVNGAVVEQFSLEVRAPIGLPANPASEVLRAIEETKSVMAMQRAELSKQFVTNGLGSDSQTALLAVVDTGMSQLQKSSEHLQRAFTAPGGEALARTFLQAMLANGLSDFQAVAKTALDRGRGANNRVKILALTPEEVCDVLIPGTCALKVAVKALDVSSSLFSASCSVAALAAFVGGVALPVDGPAIEAGALAFFVTACIPLSTAVETASVISKLVLPIDLKLQATATPNSLADSENSTIAAKVSFVGANGLCGEFIAQGAVIAVDKKLSEKIVKSLLTKNVFMSQLAKIFAKVGEKYYAKLLQSVADSVGNIVSGAQITSALGDFIGKYCLTGLNTGALAVPVSRAFAGLSATSGTLQFNPDGTGTYSCPQATALGAQKYTLPGTLPLCDTDPAQVKVEVTCGSAQVTITIGDNGSALDDIYEVIIDGQTVLTSNQPVISTSTTVNLPKGKTTVLMRGLAAPDGIGTYFINFSGAQVVSGITQGSDLTPGVIKTYVIEVQ